MDDGTLRTAIAAADGDDPYRALRELHHARVQLNLELDRAEAVAVRRARAARLELAAHRARPRGEQAGRAQEVRAYLNTQSADVCCKAARGRIERMPRARAAQEEHMSDTETRPETRSAARAASAQTPDLRGAATQPLLAARDAARPAGDVPQLLPFLFEHRPVLIGSPSLSVVGALASLARSRCSSARSSRSSRPATRSAGSSGASSRSSSSAASSAGYQHYLLQRTGEGVVLSSRKQPRRPSMLRLPIAEFDTRRTGDLVSRVGSDTTMLRAVLTQGLVEAIGGAVTFVGALIAMLIIDPVLLGLTVLVIAVAVTVVTLLSRPRPRGVSTQAQEKVGDLAVLRRARDQRRAHDPRRGRDRARDRAASRPTPRAPGRWA